MSDCEITAERLSADLDGELDEREQALLSAHLEGCAACRALKERFVALDGLVRDCSALAPPAPLEDAAAPLLTEGGPGAARGLRRLTSLAVAALVLIAASLLILVFGDRADARRAAAHSMAALQALNDETIKGQEMVLQTLEWDLQALKVSLACSEMKEQNTQTLNERIDALLKEVERIRMRENDPKGEEP